MSQSMQQSVPVLGKRIFLFIICERGKLSESGGGLLRRLCEPVVELAPSSACNVWDQAIIDDPPLFVSVEGKIHEMPEHPSRLRNTVSVYAFEALPKGIQIRRVPQPNSHFTHCKQTGSHDRCIFGGVNDMVDFSWNESCLQINVLGAFDPSGHGAIVGSSRGIIFAWERSPYREEFGEGRWEEAIAAAAADMRRQLWEATH